MIMAAIKQKQKKAVKKTTAVKENVNNSGLEKKKSVAGALNTPPVTQDGTDPVNRGVANNPSNPENLSLNGWSWQYFFSWKALLCALIFGFLALSVVLMKLSIPMPGTSVVSDPRELFTTLGSALTGPVGGIIIGVLAGIAEPGNIPLASILAHVAGAIFLGFAFKKWIYDRENKKVRYWFWMLAICVYYYVFALPGFAIGLSLFYNDPTPFWHSYGAIAKGVIFEVVYTCIISSLIWFALPKKYRAPLF
jgi:uncharacterized membrane protein